MGSLPGCSVLWLPAQHGSAGPPACLPRCFHCTPSPGLLSALCPGVLAVPEKTHGSPVSARHHLCLWLPCSEMQTCLVLCCVQRAAPLWRWDSLPSTVRDAPAGRTSTGGPAGILLCTHIVWVQEWAGQGPGSTRPDLRLRAAPAAGGCPDLPLLSSRWVPPQARYLQGQCLLLLCSPVGADTQQSLLPGAGGELGRASGSLQSSLAPVCLGQQS